MVNQKRRTTLIILGMMVVLGIISLNSGDKTPLEEPSVSSNSAPQSSETPVEPALKFSPQERAVLSAVLEEESIFISGGLPVPSVASIQHMKLRLPDGSAMRVNFSKYEISSTGAVNWTGRIEGEPESFFSLSVVGDAVEGYTLSERGEFLLTGNPVGELELTAVKLPDEFCETCRAMHDPAAGYGDTYYELDAVEPAALAAGDPVVDVLVVYTPLALADAGSLDALLAKANQMINSLNNIMSSSGADATANLIGIAPVSHPAAGATSDGSCSTLWNRLKNASDGQLDEAHVYREAYGADMVCVFGKATGYGVASIGGVWSAADFSDAHGVMPHELGHNLGCGHNDVGSAADQTNLQGVYSYSFGHYFDYGGEQRGTLMSYIGRRSTTFSNPNNTWNGVVTGTATRDHARTIRTFAPIAAGWKTSNPTDYDQDGIPNSEESGSADADGDGLPDMLDPDHGVQSGFALSAPFFDQESHPGDNSTVWNAGTSIENITDGSWVRYGNVEFGFSGVGSIDVEAASGAAGGDVEVRLGGLDGILISTLSITNTGGWTAFETFNAPVHVPVVGVHDVYFVFKGGAGNLFDIESMFFNELQQPVGMEAEDAGIVSGTVKSDAGASGGYYVDGAAGFEVAWNADASAETTALDFRVKTPSGTRSMGVFVNGVKQGVVVSSSSIWEIQSLYSVAMNLGMNTIELRDSEGSAELDVDALTHYLTGRELLQWSYDDAGRLAYGWYGGFKLQACTNLTASGWLDVVDGGNSPFIHSTGTDPDAGKYFRLIEDPKPAIGKSYTWNAGSEAFATKHMTTSEYGGIISLNLDAVNNDPYIRLNWGNTNGDIYHVVKMRVRNNTDGSDWRIYFKPQGGTEGGNSVPVSVPANGAWEIITVDMKNDPDFTGTIESIRLDQQTLTEGTADIDYVHLITAP